MKAKIRGFARYADGSPWPGATLEFSLGFTLPPDPTTVDPIKRTKPRPIRVVIAAARTDHQGYAVIDLATLQRDTRSLMIATFQALAQSGSGEAVLSIAEDPEARAPVLALSDVLVLLANSQMLSSQDASEFIAAAALDTCRAISVTSSLGPPAVPTVGTVGQVERPDSCDYRLSPASFVLRSIAMAGDGQGCEHLMPSAYPVRSRMFRRIVVRNPQRPNPSSEKIYTSPTEFLGALYPGVELRVAQADDNLTANNQPRFAEVHEYEQTWFGLGHSLGEIKYSLALAPGEAVRMAVIDWSRTDLISRDDTTRYLEDLRHRQSRDRDIDDILDGRLREDQGGGSFQAGVAGGAKATVPVKGVPIEINTGLGLGGGVSHSWGGHDVRAREQQALQERILQDTALYRSQTSTVVIQATQAERNVLATRIVANMNRMHALTISYYEVLRHFRIATRWKRTQYALLVPVSLITFDEETARRFRPGLEDALLDPSLAPHFDALDRLKGGPALYATLAAEAAAESGTGASSGRTGSGNEATPRLETKTATFRMELWSGPANNSDTWGKVRVLLKLSGQDERIELLSLGPYTLGDLFKGTFVQESEQGTNLKGGNLDQRLEARGSKTLKYFRYQNQALSLDTPVEVNLIDAVEVEWTRVSAKGPLDPAPGRDAFDLDRLIVEAVFPGNQPKMMLVNKQWQRTENTATFGPTNQDNPIKQIVPVTARITQPATKQATGSLDTKDAVRKPAKLPPTEAGDKALVAMLVAHLNANRYHYGMIAWAGMPASERRRRVEAALGGIAEGLGDEVLGIIGFSIVLPWDGPVPPWVPSLEKMEPPAPEEDIVTLPTRGVFAEAHLGRCNGAEERDITRLWNFAELPVSLLPNIKGLTPGPRGQTPDVKPNALPPAVVNIINPPEAPSPTGLASVLQTLQTPGIFRDMSGLKEVSDLLGRLIESGAEPKKDLMTAKEKVDQEIGKGVSDAGKPPAIPPEETRLSPPPLIPAPETPRPPRPPQEEWDIWKVGDTSGKGGKPAGTKQDANEVAFDLSLRLFVPSPLWSVPLRGNLSDLGTVAQNLINVLSANLGVLDSVLTLLRGTGRFPSSLDANALFALFRSRLIASGDGEDFSKFWPTTSRALATYKLVARRYRGSWGLAQWESPSLQGAGLSLTLDVPGMTTSVPNRPPWWRQPASGVRLPSVWADAGKGSATIEKIPGAGDDVFRLSFAGKPFNISQKRVLEMLALPVDIPLIGGSLNDWAQYLAEQLILDMDVEVDLKLATTSNGGPTIAVVGGHHDQFPALELRANSDTLYRFPSVTTTGVDWSQLDPVGLAVLPGIGDVSIPHGAARPIRR